MSLVLGREDELAKPILYQSGPNIFEIGVALLGSDVLANHTSVGDHIVRVLTMKEAITETRVSVLDALLKIPANFYVVTEWTPLPADKARKK